MSRLRVSIALVSLLTASGCGLGGGDITPIRTAFNRGVYLESVGDLEGAIAEYRDALDEDPGDHRARFNLGAAYEERAWELGGEGDDAAAAELRARARVEYETILAQWPEHPRASVNLGAVIYEEDPAAGVDYMRDLIARQPSRAAPRATLAAMLLHEGKTDDAVELLEAALDREPASLPAHLLLGDARRALGDHDGARDAYEAALRRDPDDLSALLALGQLECGLQRWREAEVRLERLLLVDPDHAEGHALLGEVYEAVGELEGAALHLWYARELAPRRFGGDETSERLIGLYGKLLEVEQERLTDGD